MDLLSFIFLTSNATSDTRQYGLWYPVRVLQECIFLIIPPEPSSERTGYDAIPENTSIPFVATDIAYSKYRPVCGLHPSYINGKGMIGSHNQIRYYYDTHQKNDHCQNCQ